MGGGLVLSKWCSRNHKAIKHDDLSSLSKCLRSKCGQENEQSIQLVAFVLDVTGGDKTQFLFAARGFQAQGHFPSQPHSMLQGRPDFSSNPARGVSISHVEKGACLPEACLFWVYPALFCPTVSLYHKVSFFLASFFLFPVQLSNEWICS
jgi:hypothetical protein